MDDKIIFIYCIGYDFLKSFHVNDDLQCKMNTAEIITVAIVSAVFFGGNFSRSRLFLKTYGYIPKMLSESRLNRRLHEIDLALWQAIFHAISKSFIEDNNSLEYLVDSMPVEVCMNIRNYRCKLLNGKQFIGFCKAKKKFYFGFKIHMITTSEGKPIEFIITPASIADITAFKMMDIDLQSGSIIFGDKAYTDYRFEDLVKEIENIKILPQRKVNASRQFSGCLHNLQSVARKRIETTFSILSGMFSRKIHAVTSQGFILKMIIFVVTLSIKLIV